ASTCGCRSPSPTVRATPWSTGRRRRRGRRRGSRTGGGTTRGPIGRGGPLSRTRVTVWMRPGLSPRPAPLHADAGGQRQTRFHVPEFTAKVPALENASWVIAWMIPAPSAVRVIAVPPEVADRLNESAVGALT